MDVRESPHPLSVSWKPGKLPTGVLQPYLKNPRSRGTLGDHSWSRACENVNVLSPTVSQNKGKTPPRHLCSVEPAMSRMTLRPGGESIFWDSGESLLREGLRPFRGHHAELTSTHTFSVGYTGNNKKEVNQLPIISHPSCQVIRRVP